MAQADSALLEAIHALTCAVDCFRRGEPFEALAFIHGAKEKIETAETLIDSARKPLGPPEIIS
jgi:hypothetical protein